MSSGIVDTVSTPQTPAVPNGEDLAGMARSMCLLFELSVRSLMQNAGPSELARRVIEHLAGQPGGR
jgi:hypothetical protein